MASHEIPVNRVTIDPTEDYRLDDERLGTVLSEIHTSSKGIRMHVVDARPESSEIGEDGYPKRVGKTYIMPRHFLSFTDVELDQLTDGVLADAMGARIIAIDTPGAGLHISGKTTFRQKLKLLRGNFSDHARLQLEAVKELDLGDDPIDKVGLIGYSLGAKAVASMLEQDIEVESIDMIEAVNDRNWLLPKLLRNMMREDKQVDEYLLETKKAQPPATIEKPSGPRITAYDRDPEDPTKVIKGMGVPQSTDTKLVALGMGTAGFAKRLVKYRNANPKKFEDVPINIYRAENSSMARRHTNMKLAQEAGAHYTELSSGNREKPLGHRFLLALGRVAALGKEMAKRHDEQSSR